MAIILGIFVILLIMNDGDREQLIREAISGCRKKGVTIGSNAWGIEWSGPKKIWRPIKEKNCCPLACVLLEHQTKYHMPDYRNHTVEMILQVNSEWVRAFQNGFDGHPKPERDDGTFAYELGFLLKEELLK